MDLTTNDETGRPWDFNELNMRNAAIRKLIQDKPRLLIGSPMCGPFGVMNNINYSRMSEEEKQQRITYGRRHLEICIKLYQIQWREGRYFRHEHPESASSWHEECVQGLLKRQGVVRVVGDQCVYGLKSQEGQRIGPARKSTGFMTNSPCIAKKLSRRCPNRNGTKIHNNVQLSDGRAKAAQIYPPGLCRALCQGLMEQIKIDRMGQFLIAQINLTVTGASDQMKQEAESIRKRYKTIEEDQDEELEMAWDDVSGAQSNPEAIKKARMEEVQYVRKINLYTKVPIAECIQKIGKKLIAV